jgi:hypothetical protein
MFFLGMNTGLAVVMAVTFFDFLAAKNQKFSGRSVIITGLVFMSSLLSLNSRSLSSNIYFLIFADHSKDPFSGFNDQAPEVKPTSYIRSVSRHAERQIAPSMSAITNALLFATQDGKQVLQRAIALFESHISVFSVLAVTTFSPTFSP